MQTLEISKQDLAERIKEAEFHYKKMKITKKRVFQEYYFHACLNALYTSWNYIAAIDPCFFKLHKKDSQIKWWVGLIRGQDTHKAPKRLGKLYRPPKKMPKPTFPAVGYYLEFYEVKLLERDSEYFAETDRTHEIKKELKNIMALFKKVLL